MLVGVLHHRPTIWALSVKICALELVVAIMTWKRDTGFQIPYDISEFAYTGTGSFNPLEISFELIDSSIQDVARTRNSRIERIQQFVHTFEVRDVSAEIRILKRISGYNIFGQSNILRCSQIRTPSSGTDQMRLQVFIFHSSSSAQILPHPQYVCFHF